MLFNTKVCGKNSIEKSGDMYYFLKLKLLLMNYL